MDANTINNYYKFVVSELNTFEEKIDPLLAFAREYNETITSMLQSFLGAAKIFRDGTDTHYVTSNPSLLNDFTTIIKNFKSSFLVFPAFLEYGSMKSRISDYKRENGFKDTEIEEFYAVLDDTFTTYQEFLQSSDDRKKAICFGQSVIKLEEYFKSLKISYQNIIKLLDNTAKPVSAKSTEKTEVKATTVQKPPLTPAQPQAKSEFAPSQSINTVTQAKPATENKPQQ